MGSCFAPAKVNLFLHVGASDADGYHPISSLMVFADLGDRVALSPEPGLKVHGPFAGDLAAGADNLVTRATEAFRAALSRPSEVFGLALDKQLPVAAGLGGGSSDAGAALRLLRKQLRQYVDDRVLEAVAAAMGADGAACLWGRPVVAQGRGERLSPAPILPVLDAVLVNPRRPVSTAEVYRRFDERGPPEGVLMPYLPERLESAAEAAAWLGGLRNDLEPAAVATEPLVGKVLDAISSQPETLLARVSGSGGTCFALCAGDLEAEGLAERLEAMAPGWWVRRCRLGGPWPD